MAKRQRESSTMKRPGGRGGTRRESPRFGREDLAKFYGIQCCLTIFAVRRNEIRRVFVSQEREEAFRDVIAWAEQRGLPARVVDSEELGRVAGTEHHEGVCLEAKPLVGRPPGEVSRLLGELQRGLVLILEGVENPHNVGAILRTACFFGVDAVCRFIPEKTHV